MQKAIDLRDKNTFKNDDFYFIANGKIFNKNNKKELLKHIGQAIMELKKYYLSAGNVGSYKGFEITTKQMLKSAKMGHRQNIFGFEALENLAILLITSAKYSYLPSIYELNF